MNRAYNTLGSSSAEPGHARAYERGPGLGQQHRALGRVWGVSSPGRPNRDPVANNISRVMLPVPLRKHMSRNRKTGHITLALIT